ncbi:hypothetical protein HMPREF1565_0668 [Providencia alcalifaciens RIMD 1656011]|nr:hypothetical protein HMPREF1565_0668 [Providencia alcalifaciens RIMD 1656011]
MTQPIAEVMTFECKMKTLYPSIQGQALYLHYLAHLPDS